jgi:hypothetical protein
LESLLNIIANDPSFVLSDYFSLANIYGTLWSYTLSSTNSSNALTYNLTSELTSTQSISSTLYSLGVRGTMLTRFINNGDGTVFDLKNGLMWMQDDANGGTTMLYKDALSYCNTLNATGFAGYTDWRIPSRNELLSLLDAAINTWDIYIEAFPNSGSLYWTSSSSFNLANNAWQVDFTVNAWEISLGGYTTQSNAFRAVRGGTIE